MQAYKPNNILLNNNYEQINRKKKYVYHKVINKHKIYINKLNKLNFNAAKNCILY